MSGSPGFSNEMTAEWFFTPELTSERYPVALDSSESHHLIRVLRKKKDDPVIVWNGRGGVAESVIIEACRSRVIVKPVTFQQYTRTLPPIILLVAEPRKNEVFKQILVGCTALSVSDFIPVISARSKKGKDWESKIARWEKVIISACKQSHQSILPKLHAPVDLEQLPKLEALQDKIKYVGWEPQLGSAKNISELSSEQTAGFCWLVGPAGGWEPREAEFLLQNNFSALQLGRLTLTTTMACFTGITALRTHYRLLD